MLRRRYRCWMHQDANCPEGNCPEGNCPEDNCPNDNCPEGNCPRTKIMMLRTE